MASQCTCTNRHRSVNPTLPWNTCPPYLTPDLASLYHAQTRTLPEHFSPTNYCKPTYSPRYSRLLFHEIERSSQHHKNDDPELWQWTQWTLQQRGCPKRFATVDTPNLNSNVDTTHDDRLQHTSKVMNMNTHIHGIQTDTPTKVHLTFHVCQVKGIT